MKSHQWLVAAKIIPKNFNFMALEAKGNFRTEFNVKAVKIHKKKS